MSTVFYALPSQFFVLYLEAQFSFPTLTRNRPKQPRTRTRCSSPPFWGTFNRLRLNLMPCFAEKVLPWTQLSFLEQIMNCLIKIWKFLDLRFPSFKTISLSWKFATPTCNSTLVAKSIQRVLETIGDVVSQRWSTCPVSHVLWVLIPPCASFFVLFLFVTSKLSLIRSLYLSCEKLS